jgi:hypothetical protein
MLQWLQKKIVQMLEVRMESKANLLQFLKADPALEHVTSGALHT